MKNQASTFTPLERYFALLAGGSAFIPFFSPFPINTDVQPLFFLLIIPLFLFNKMQRFTKFELIFAFFAIWSFIYIDVTGLDFSLRKSLGLILAFLAYHFFRVYFRVFTDRFLFFVFCCSNNIFFRSISLFLP